LSQLDDVRGLIIKRLANTSYLSAIVASLPPGQVGERALFELAAAVEPKARVDAEARIIADLLGRRDYDATSRALRHFRLASGQADVIVQDGSFSGTKGPQPFNWLLTADADVRAEITPVDQPGPPSALRVERFSAASVVAARQSIIVRAGRYRLSHLVKTGGEAPPADTAPDFTWTITCPALAKPSLASLPLKTATLPRWTTESWEFEVPPTCRLLELALVSTAADFSRHADVMISRVRLDPIGR
jgi:hypothetical protein